MSHQSIVNPETKSNESLDRSNENTSIGPVNENNFLQVCPS